MPSTQLGARRCSQPAIAASLTTTATSASPVGSYSITAAQGTLAAANYSFSYVGSQLTVTPAVLTITASPTITTRQPPGFRIPFRTNRPDSDS